MLLKTLVQDLKLKSTNSVRITKALNKCYLNFSFGFLKLKSTSSVRITEALINIT